MNIQLDLGWLHPIVSVLMGLDPPSEVESSTANEHIKV